MGVDLAQITFLGLTVQTWITVVIAAFGLMVSLLTFARGWRWRAEAAPLFAMLEGDIWLENARAANAAAERLAARRG